MNAAARAKEEGLGPCVVFGFDSAPCGEPGVAYDQVRKGPICARHNGEPEAPADFLTRVRHAGL